MARASWTRRATAVQPDGAAAVVFRQKQLSQRQLTRHLDHPPPIGATAIAWLFSPNQLAVQL
jgi:hypothetical protein